MQPFVVEDVAFYVWLNVAVLVLLEGRMQHTSRWQNCHRKNCRCSPCFAGRSYATLTHPSHFPPKRPSCSPCFAGRSYATKNDHLDITQGRRTNVAVLVLLEGRMQHYWANRERILERQVAVLVLLEGRMQLQSLFGFRTEIIKLQSLFLWNPLCKSVLLTV